MRHDDVPLKVGKMTMVKVPTKHSIEDSLFRAMHAGIHIEYEWNKRIQKALVQVYVTSLSTLDEDHRIFEFKGTTTVDDQLVGVEGVISYKEETGVLYLVRKSKV